MNRPPMDRRYRDPRAPPSPTIRSTVATTALFLGVLVLASWPVATVAGLTAALTARWAVRRFGWPSLGGRGPTTGTVSNRTRTDVAGETSADPR